MLALLQVIRHDRQPCLNGPDIESFIRENSYRKCEMPYRITGMHQAGHLIDSGYSRFLSRGDSL
ncbi:MAG: hypothetical protein DRH11_02470, partial [Deltaproteobacteria bacterium]